MKKEKSVRMTYDEILKLCNNKETLLLGFAQIAKKFNFKIITDLNINEKELIKPGIYSKSSLFNFVRDYPNYYVYTDCFVTWKRFKSSKVGKILNTYDFYNIYKDEFKKNDQLCFTSDKIISSVDIANIIKNNIDNNENPLLVVNRNYVNSLYCMCFMRFNDFLKNHGYLSIRSYIKNQYLYTTKVYEKTN